MEGEETDANVNIGRLDERKARKGRKSSVDAKTAKIKGVERKENKKRCSLKEQR